MTALAFGVAGLWLAWLTRRAARRDRDLDWLRRETRQLLIDYGKLKRQVGWGDDLDVTQCPGDPKALTMRIDPAVIEDYRKGED